jgi:hypothetical protein
MVYTDAIRLPYFLGFQYLLATVVPRPHLVCAPMCCMVVAYINKRIYPVHIDFLCIYYTYELTELKKDFFCIYRTYELTKFTKKFKKFTHVLSILLDLYIKFPVQMPSNKGVIKNNF